MLLPAMLTLVTAQQPSRPAALARVEKGAESGPFKPTWESLEGFQPPEWYLDGKFGIFIHWGVYSVPAFGSEWYPRQMYQQGSAEFKHHVATFGSQKVFGYKDFIPMFRAEKFDADAWAKLFREAGAKFVVPVAEHHDGFPMYDTQWSDWSAAKMGPKQDIIGELSTAVRKEGMVFGLSSHRAEHWWFYNGGRAFDSDVNDPKYAGLYGPAQPENTQPDKAFLDDWLLRTTELVDKYHPQLVWFDWWIEQPAFQPYLKEFASYYYNQAHGWHKGVAINYKNSSFAPQSAVLDLERGQLASTRKLFWQTDTSVSKNSWGHVANQDYKTSHEIIGDLIDIVSKNGALLLNIGPKSDGTIPDQEQQILRDMGAWLKVNGDAIYGTRPFRIYGEGPTHVGGGMFTDTNRSQFTSGDFRFTVKGDTLYAICLAWPEKEAVIKSLAAGSDLVGGKVVRVELLGHHGSLEFKQEGDGLHIQMPSEKPCTDAYSFKITGLKDVAFDSRVRQSHDGSITLNPSFANLKGSIQVEEQGGRSDLGYWDDPESSASWDVECRQAGTFHVVADFAAAAGPSDVEIEIGGRTLRAIVPQTSSWGDYRTVDFGTVEIAGAGDVTIAVHAAHKATWKAVNLAQIRLRRN